MYKLFTMPHCDKCDKVKEFLNEQKIEYEVVDLGKPEGVGELRTLFPKIKDQVERINGQLPLPLFLSINDEEVVAKGNLEDIKAMILNGWY